MKLSITGSFVILSVLLFQGNIDGAPHEAIGTRTSSALTQATVLDDMDGMNTFEVKGPGFNLVDLGLQNDSQNTDRVTENPITNAAGKETATPAGEEIFKSTTLRVLKKRQAPNPSKEPKINLKDAKAYVYVLPELTTTTEGTYDFMLLEIDPDTDIALSIDG